MLPNVPWPMGSWLGHIRNLDLSDLFLDIFHFYTKALLNSQKLTKLHKMKYHKFPFWDILMFSMLQFLVNGLFQVSEIIKFWLIKQNWNDKFKKCPFWGIFGYKSWKELARLNSIFAEFNSMFLWCVLVVWIKWSSLYVSS